MSIHAAVVLSPRLYDNVAGKVLYAYFHRK